MHIFLLLPLLVALNVPTIAWETFYASIGATGVTYSEAMRKLEGKRVRIRGHAVQTPRFDGGCYLTRFGHGDPHGVGEHDLPFDAAAVIWRKGLTISGIPRRPTVEGILRLGNRRLGAEEVVTVTIEDATPVIPTEISR